MRGKKFFLLFTLAFVLIAGVFTSAFSPPSAPVNQDNATAQQQTIEARVNELFTQTAVAAQQATATANAFTATANAFETQVAPTRIALTETAAFANTVQAMFNDSLTATVAFNATVAAQLSQLATATAIAASMKGQVQVGEPVMMVLTAASGDRWTFDAVAGDILLISMSSFDFTPFMELYGPENQYLAVSDFAVEGRTELYFTVKATGTYTILARSADGFSIGNYTVELALTELITLAANDFDTYPGGYQVTVQKYEIDPARNAVRLYFEATARSSDLRSPDGTYLLTSSGRVYPLRQDWTSAGRTYYSGWMEFDAAYFRNEASLRLIYCGCGFYEIFLTDLRSYFTSPVVTTVSGAPISGNWNLTWDQERLDCGRTTMVYFGFVSALSLSSDGVGLIRTVVGGATARYALVSPGVYNLQFSYNDLDATVTSETIQVHSPAFITGQRTDTFPSYDCSLTVSYRMERVSDP